MEPLKKLARWILRDDIRSLESLAESRRVRARRAEGQLLQQTRRIRTLTAWGRAQAMTERTFGGTTLLAWGEYALVGAAGVQGAGVSVHPFDRWCITPKP